mgnify:CR=1 FL=1
MARQRKYPAGRFHSPQAIEVQENDEKRPTTVKLEGTNLRIAKVNERWEEEEPETEWRASPMTLEHYLVTLEDGQQLTIIKNMTYGRWYYTAV